MKHEQPIHDNKEVVWVPECIESSKPVKGLRELHMASTEPVGCKCEGNSHANHHQNSSNTFNSADKIYVPGLHLSKVTLQRHIVIRWWRYQPWEITSKVVPSMENDSNHNGSRNCLQTTRKFQKIKIKKSKGQVAQMVNCILQNFQNNKSNRYTAMKKMRKANHVIYMNLA